MERWLQISEIVRNIGILIGGAIGIYLAWRCVAAANRQAEAQIRQAELARREHVAELINRSVGQLADAKLEVRLGAIFTLREAARDFPDLSAAVFEVLSAYVRESARDYADSEPPVDIQAIMDMLAMEAGAGL
ncbi:MAG: hypothetical protein ACHQAY_24295 [Hyphomicrobiales bacterium]